MSDKISVKFNNNDGTYSINGKKVNIDKFEKGLREEEKLIPQLWWGEIDNPEIVVLSNNPHYGLSDEYENQQGDIRKILKENLERNKSEDIDIKDILFSKESIFSTTVTANWWHNVFKDSKEYQEYMKEHDKDDSQFLSAKKIGIFNLIGYYSKSFTASPKYENLKEYIEFVKNKIDKAEKVYIIWGEKYWQSFGAFEKHENKFFINKHKPCPNISDDKYEAFFKEEK